MCIYFNVDSEKNALPVGTAPREVRLFRVHGTDSREHPCSLTRAQVAALCQKKTAEVTPTRLELATSRPWG